MMGNEKWVVPIGIHDIDGLVLEKKGFQPFVLLGMNETKFIGAKDLVSFRDGQREIGSSHWDTRF